MFDLYYSKHKNNGIFQYLENEDTYSNMQNYIPLYNTFFNLNDTNWNNVNLNNDTYLESIVKKHSDTNYTIQVNNNKQSYNTETFVKLAPLYDPVKFMSGKYASLSDDEIFELPKYSSEETNTPLTTYSNSLNIQAKKESIYNSAYTDSFFSYLTSKIYNSHNFIHGLQFYGSYIGIKNNLTINIADEIDYLQESEYFFQSNNKEFTIDKSIRNEIMNIGTRKYKAGLKFSSSALSEFSLDNIEDLQLDDVFNSNESASIKTEYNEEIIYNHSISKDDASSKHTNSSSSSCSSRFSNTSSSSQEEHDDDCDESYDDDEDNETDDEDGKHGENETHENDNDTMNGSVCNSSVLSDESMVVNVTLHKCPVHLIFLEKMEDTLDSYIMNNELSVTEWKSILFQVVCQLYAYQHMFDFTHNDLHTNNIMYQTTEKKHIIYNINGAYYKVPTYGKLYKIIDFGRAIYRFKGQRICSDSYQKKGDAHTQYNCEPFYNENKKRLEPNYAFDLCRLGCSLYDYFEEEIVLSNLGKSTQHTVIADLIDEWCTDDNGMNILYKKNGRDRYPGFKLYKMIARTVSKHTPKQQLDNGVFDAFKTSKKKLNKRAKIIYIDRLPSYV